MRPVQRGRGPVVALPTDAMDRARQDAGLSHDELWLRYFALGGMTESLELEAYLLGALRPTAHDRVLLVHALHERFLELGSECPIPYSDEPGAAPNDVST